VAASTPPVAGAEWAQALRFHLGVGGTRRPLEVSALSTVRRATLVLAHMDDEVNVVGLLSRLAAAGVEVEVVVLTDGAANPWTDQAVVGARTHFECRRAELQASMRVLSLKEAVTPGFPDSALRQHLDEATTVVANTLAQSGSDLLITFDPKGLNRHPDHMAAHLVARRALVAAGRPMHLAMLAPPPPFCWALGAGFRWHQAPAIATLTLTPEERERKARVFEAHASQWKTLRLLTAGLPPRLFFTAFPTEWFIWLKPDDALAWADQRRA
jgi:N-acetylglucosamine malate deacetylase 2